MIWPAAIAPFVVVICPVGYDRFPQVKAAADELHQALVDAGVDVVLDDRGERPGAMFADWELVGVPHRVAIGERSLKDNLVEYQGRQDLQSTPVPIDQIRGWLMEKLAP
ncbi:MAG: proline--tRNA ligase, partial [Burkholderiaceae bacterium]|nr:proline--tRNA ligase [Burkholderiaceae bacterium]